MRRRPPSSTLTDTLFPDTTLFLSERLLGPAKLLVQPLDQVLHPRPDRGQGDIRVPRRLVGRVDSSEVAQLASARLGIESLDVTPLRNFQRRIAEHLQELTLGEQLPRHPSFGTDWQIGRGSCRERECQYG